MLVAPGLCLHTEQETPTGELSMTQVVEMVIQSLRQDMCRALGRALGKTRYRGLGEEDRTGRDVQDTLILPYSSKQR